MATERNAFHSNDTISKVIVTKHTQCEENVLNILLEKTQIIALSCCQIDFCYWILFLCHNNSFYHYRRDPLCSWFDWITKPTKQQTDGLFCSQGIISFPHHSDCPEFCPEHSGGVSTQRQGGRFSVSSFNTIGYFIYEFHVVRCTMSKSVSGYWNQMALPTYLDSLTHQKCWVLVSSSAKWR